MFDAKTGSIWVNSGESVEEAPCQLSFGGGWSRVDEPEGKSEDHVSVSLSLTPHWNFPRDHDARKVVGTESRIQHDSPSSKFSAEEQSRPRLSPVLVLIIPNVDTVLRVRRMWTSCTWKVYRRVLAHQPPHFLTERGAMSNSQKTPDLKQFLFHYFSVAEPAGVGGKVLVHPMQGLRGPVDWAATNHSVSATAQKLLPFRERWPRAVRTHCAAVCQWRSPAKHTRDHTYSTTHLRGSLSETFRRRFGFLPLHSAAKRWN
ncbi:hypothetical protein VUR80DRAFT_10299 [Thermomyces stellatus]